MYQGAFIENDIDVDFASYPRALLALKKIHHKDNVYLRNFDDGEEQMKEFMMLRHKEVLD